VEGIVRIHVPFSLADLSQIEKCLGSFTTNPDSYVKEFQYLAQSYDLTWHDIYLILSSTLLPEERCTVWDMARVHADDVHCTTPAHPVGATVVPTEEPHWNYQTGDRTLRDQVVTCLVVGLKKPAQKVVNFDKLREIQQDKEENPASFLSQLTEALRHHTKVDPKTKDGIIILMTHFSSHSTPDIKKNTLKG
jgi:hypothetical protein